MKEKLQAPLWKLVISKDLHIAPALSDAIIKFAQLCSDNELFKNPTHVSYNNIASTAFFYQFSARPRHWLLYSSTSGSKLQCHSLDVITT